MSTPSKKRTASEKLPDIGELLVCSDTGNPKPILANALIMLRYDPAWAGVLTYDEFSLFVITKKDTPWGKPIGTNWTDTDDSLTAEWLQRLERPILVSSKIAAEAVQTVAKENRYHPVREYLSSLQWDQQPRIERWLSTYLGAKDTVFARAVGTRWLISAVARIFQPGCQADHTLLLEGPQGIRKSSALRVLASDPWFADHISELGSKDSRVELHGKWILEHSELDRIRHGALERIKAFLTARVDTFRPPYGKRSESFKRSCVFAASVNDENSLTDETGNRRFWPVRCGTIDMDALSRDRSQIWAEAHEHYRAGNPWHLETAELTALAQAEQEQRYDVGVWDDVVLAWADEPVQRDARMPFDSTPGHVTITDVLIHAIGKDLDRCTQADRNQVARALIHDKWVRVREGKGALRGRWFYCEPRD